MNVLHFLASGGAGGIESLMRDYADYSTHNNTFVFFWKGGVNYERMKSAGHRVLVLDHGKGEFIKTYFRLLALIKDENIEAVITHHAAPLFWAYLVLLKKKHNNLKLFIYAHGSMEDMYRTDKKGVAVRNAIFGYAFKKCNAVIAISNSVKNSIMAWGYDANKIKVVYNGVDCRKYKGNKRDNDLFRVIFVGRLIKQKGVQLLIQALRILDDECTFGCDIVGDGPMRAELEALTQTYNMKNEVIFHGTRHDIPEMLVRSHIFVHPAIWEEGFGISLVEAMAAGTVPIAFRKGAIPEIIDDHINGFIVDDCNAEAMARTIGYVMKMVDTDGFKQLQNNARAKATCFELSKYVGALDKTIGEK